MTSLVKSLVGSAPVFLSLGIIFWQASTICSAQPWQFGGPFGASNGDARLLLLSDGGLFLLGFFWRHVVEHHDNGKDNR
jgi:hypothetical protein